MDCLRAAYILLIYKDTEVLERKPKVEPVTNIRYTMRLIKSIEAHNVIDVFRPPSSPRV